LKRLARSRLTGWFWFSSFMLRDLLILKRTELETEINLILGFRREGILTKNNVVVLEQKI
jgi:hypothetical protein